MSHALWNFFHFVHSFVFVGKEDVFDGGEDDLVGCEEHGQVATGANRFRCHVSFRDLHSPTKTSYYLKTTFRKEISTALLNKNQALTANHLQVND